ncbi:hypothetical protein CRYUN_Cryun27aG0067800 [Craigia yunnanensis]
MAISDYRDQALSLLTAANNHADLAVKLSSLKQAKDILSSLHSSSAADLQRFSHSLVRKFLVEIIEDITLKTMEHSSILVPVLVAFLRDVDSNVVRQSIVSGTNFFCSVLEEMALQFQLHCKVDRWVEELWMWMVRFKEGVFSIALEHAVQLSFEELMAFNTVALLVHILGVTGLDNVHISVHYGAPLVNDRNG